MEFYKKVQEKVYKTWEVEINPTLRIEEIDKQIAELQKEKKAIEDTLNLKE